jgi:hypothetical protein
LCFHLLDITVIFMYITPVISGSSGEEFDWGSWKETRSPHSQIRWKNRCGSKKCFANRVAITNTGQQNHLPDYSAVCIRLTSRGMVQHISAPDSRFPCVWCLVSRNITLKWICKLCFVIKHWSKVPQIFCGNNKHVNDKLFTLHFIQCM